MFHGVLALIGWSLRGDSRSLQSHLSRLALCVAIYVGLCSVLWNSRLFGAPGLRFFSVIGYMNLTFMSLLGISFFSTAISEEKEEDTLGLMLMAGISPVGILIGKSGSRLIQGLLLIAVQYPFTLLAVMMGGVTTSQVGAVYVGLSAYMVLLAGLGLFCSTVGSNNRMASMWMILGLSLYAFVPLFASNYIYHRLRNGLTMTQVHDSVALTIIDLIGKVSIFPQMGAITVTGFDESLWSIQVVSNLLFGLVGFVASWGVFGICSRQPATEVMTRGLVTSGRGHFRWLSPGRVWGNCFVWKDFHFVAGGVGMIFVRFALSIVLLGATTLQSFFSPMTGIDISLYQFFLSLAVTVDACRVMARSLYDEVRGQTLSTLTVLPSASLTVVYSKLAGALLGWLPGLLIILLVSVFTEQGWTNFGRFMVNHEGPAVLSMFVFAPNLAALLALFMRWGAVPLSLVLSYGVHFVVVVSLESLHQRNAVYPAGFVLLLTLNLACHLGIMFRIRRLATVT